MAHFDKDKVHEACERVRNDKDPLNWVAFTYEGTSIVKSAEGENYDELSDFMKTNADRVYGYLRVQTGDDMSKRSKFAFIAYIGDNASPLQKAKCSTDKACIKHACNNFAKEFAFDGEPETLEEITKQLRKVGGANYNGQAS